MTSTIKRLFSLARPSNPVPPQYKSIFFHLYMDMAWMGLVSGTTMAFLSVFSTRQGANTFQIGLLSAVPGLVNLLFALPSANWISKRSMGKAVFWSSALSRIFYALLVPLPVLFLPGAQVWLIISITFIMTIPGTALVVGFNSLFAEIVPVEWRGHVIGIRNALLALVATIFTFLSGQLLHELSFPLGYQVLFGVGFAGAALSSFHLYLLARHYHTPPAQSNQQTVRSSENRGNQRNLTEEIQNLIQRRLKDLRIDVIKGPYRKTMLLLFGWHLAQFMTIPCVTPFIVNELHISDQMIGFSNGLFNLTVFLGSLQLSRVASRFGNKRITGSGIMMLSLFPILTTFGIGPYIIANFIGGLAWALVNGGIYNFLLERIPSDDRPTYLAWYNLVSNAAILIGSLCGPAVGGVIGLSTALLVFGFGRFLAGVAILRWG